jgi:hypothetical protein
MKPKDQTELPGLPALLGTRPFIRPTATRVRMLEVLGGWGPLSDREIIERAVVNVGAFSFESAPDAFETLRAAGFIERAGCVHRASITTDLWRVTETGRDWLRSLTEGKTT